jgi:hypothetical protein
MDDGTIPVSQLVHSRYADLIDDPLAALEKLYRQMGLPFTEAAQASVSAYLAHKPKGKFGAHHYHVDTQDRTRALFHRYQSRFDVPSED